VILPRPVGFYIMLSKGGLFHQVVTVVVYTVVLLILSSGNYRIIWINQAVTKVERACSGRHRS
jgi:hypothetical protein